MARFQAQTNVVLEQEIEDLRRRLGLRTNQKADLLRELTALAGWVVRQAVEGRTIEARGEDGLLQLEHPVVERLRRQYRQSSASASRLELSDDETRRLADILDRRFDPPLALLETLRRLTNPERQAPDLTWNDADP